MILDYIQGFELSDQEADRHFDSMMALARLGEGLWWIYGEVRQMEHEVRARAIKEGVETGIVEGVLEGLPMGRLSCAFQWYAVSACNYVQLVGWLSSRNPGTAKRYVAKILPRIHRFRNKVAAHFALTTPRGDNEADLAASVMTHIIYDAGRLRAASITPVVEADDKEVIISEDLAWSVTQAHESLSVRYWPKGPPTAFQSLRVPRGTTALRIQHAT